MPNDQFYLKQNVKLEPLFTQWYAWSYLIPPATAAMNLVNSHLKILKSYLSAPELHVAAAKNPAMRGGPFINYPATRMKEIMALMERTQREQARLIELAGAIKTLSDMLRNEAKGYSLDTLYQKIPEGLKGYVELVYDLNNNSSFRLIEGLLYNSPFYNPSAQSVVLSIINGDQRPFVFSTPRLEDGEHLELDIPFNHPGIDELSKMRVTPQSIGYIKDICGLQGKNETLLRSFLSEDKPAGASRYDGEDIRIRYFGHACILIETKDVSLLTDPLVSYDYEAAFPRYTLRDLPDSIDYVLITHGHADHLSFETLIQLRHKIKNIVVPRNGTGFLEDPSLRLMLKKLGFTNVIEIDDMETLNIDGGSVTAVPFLGEHADLNIRTKAAHLIRLGDRSILCAADSCNLETKMYEHVNGIVGAIDALFLGMECDGAPLSWIYGALMTKPVERGMDQSRRLSGSDYRRAIDLVTKLNCGQVYVYAMGQEPWLSYITSIEYTDESKPIVESNTLVEACRERGITSERLYVMKEMFLSKNRGRSHGGRSESSIKTGPLLSWSHLPLEVQPVLDGFDLIVWCEKNERLFDEMLLDHRAILFRNCAVQTIQIFSKLAAVLSKGSLMEYKDRSTPRRELADNIYTSTVYPQDYRIALHNEGTYWTTWPLRIMFCCLVEPDQGGETPIADTRRIYNRISASIRERFAQRNVLYVRNYNDGFGLTWQDSFQTQDRRIVEEYCRLNDIEFEWKSGDRLRTRQIRRAIARHPKTGEYLWFNHAAFFHVSSLEPSIREAFIREFREEDLPYNTYYGDGSPIESDVLEELRAAYQEEMIEFAWKEGDVMVLDNMTVCHGRAPYNGQRRVAVAMAEPSTGNVHAPTLL
jgi:L-ascorbate metabolism protein UlaG (beta-lactamase superfamily)/alpha-ketoglutarate-dependent taurine dioxygenase